VKLALAHVLSTTHTHSRVQPLDRRPILHAPYAVPMREAGITAQPGQLVAIDMDADPPTIVYRWPDIDVQPSGDGYLLAQGDRRLDPAALSAEAFPRIRAMYERIAAARTLDPTQVVRDGYDQIAERYLAWVRAERSDVRMRYTQRLLDTLPPGAEVLDLGCGAGGPTTKALAARFYLTGVDLSPRSIALARQHVPGARFLQANMAELDLPASSLDGVAAFYSLIHLPRDHHPALLARIASWLRPGGVLVATLGAHGMEGDLDDFLGARMYWSSFDGEANRRLVEEAGLQIESARVEDEDEHGESVAFLWIVARKPGPEKRGA
jgi:SAM-dependent methyltransferase